MPSLLRIVHIHEQKQLSLSFPSFFLKRSSTRQNEVSPWIPRPINSCQNWTKKKEKELFGFQSPLLQEIKLESFHTQPLKHIPSITRIPKHIKKRHKTFMPNQTHTQLSPWIRIRTTTNFFLSEHPVQIKSIPFRVSDPLLLSILL